MRAARAADYRRRACERPFPVVLEEFLFENVPALGSGAVTFGGAPILICGGNGVGKTTILEAIFTVLSPAQALHGRKLERLTGGELTCRVGVDGETQAYSARVTAEGIVHEGGDPPFAVTFLDPGPQCNRWLTLLEGQANLDELLEPLEPAESDAKEVEEISYLVGKTYDSRQVFEIEELGETIPYVSVRVGQASYSFSEMGLGELALNILHWQLSHAPRRSVVLIEEPETFVSPRSQRCLVDVICRYAVEREFFPIITTHSLGVAGRLPREKVVLVHGFSAGSPDIGVLQPPRDDQLNDVLGVPRRRTGLLLVEDTAAKLFAAAILDRVDPSLFGSFEFCHAGDATQIRQILECFPQTSIVTLVGLYDAGYDAQHSEPHWGYSFLPGDNPPERELRNALDAHPEIAAGALGRTVEELHAAAAALAGEDDHDWLTGLAERLGKSDEQLVDGLADAWLAAEANYDAAVALAGNVRALL